MPGCGGDDGECLQVGELLRDRVAVVACLRQSGPDLDELVATLSDHVDQALDLGRCIAVPTLQFGALLGALCDRRRRLSWNSFR